MVKGRALSLSLSLSASAVGRRASGAAADARVSVETAWSNPHAQSTVRHLRRPVYLRVRHPLLVACPQQVDAPVDDHGDAAAAAVAAAAPPPRHAVAPVYTRRGIALDFMVDNDDEDPYDGVSYTDALARAAAIHTAQASTAQAAAQVAAASSSVASAGAASSPAPSAAPREPQPSARPRRPRRRQQRRWQLRLHRWPRQELRPLRHPLLPAAPATATPMQWACGTCTLAAAHYRWRRLHCLWWRHVPNCLPDPGRCTVIGAGTGYRTVIRGCAHPSAADRDNGRIGRRAGAPSAWQGRPAQPVGVLMSSSEPDDPDVLSRAAYARLLADPEVWAKPPRSVYEASAMAIERDYEEEPAAAAVAAAAAAPVVVAVAAAPPRKSRRLKWWRCDTCGQAPCACEDDDDALFLDA
eukprot:COSAG06_NODE_10577_length_1655_cov_2.394602_1_plen_411_part_00